MSSRVQYGNLGDKEGFTVMVSNLDSLVMLLELIKDDLTCKKSRAELLLRFCLLRRKHKNKPLTDEESELMDFWSTEIKSK